MSAAKTGVTDLVLTLLKHGADVNSKEPRRNQTALMWAIAFKHPETAKLLIEHGADVNAKTLATSDKVPNTCRICTWKSSPGGFTALMFAARSGDVESARLLLKAGANPDAATEEDGNTLVVASASGHEEVALLLLKSGADFESKDDNGVTALHYALYNGLSRIHGYTYDPVYRVRPANMPKLAKALLESGADPNAKIAKNYSIGPEIRGNCDRMTGTAGATPFLLAAASADAALLSLLAKYEADIHLAKEDGTTALIAAAHSQKLEE
jgi:ankyrin repeat protein